MSARGVSSPRGGPDGRARQPARPDDVDVPADLEGLRAQRSARSRIGSARCRDAPSTATCVVPGRRSRSWRGCPGAAAGRPGRRSSAQQPLGAVRPPRRVERARPSRRRPTGRAGMPRSRRARRYGSCARHTARWATASPHSAPGARRTRQDGADHPGRLQRVHDAAERRRRAEHPAVASGVGQRAEAAHGQAGDRPALPRAVATLEQAAQLGQVERLPAGRAAGGVAASASRCRSRPGPRRA